MTNPCKYATRRQLCKHFYKFDFDRFYSRFIFVVAIICLQYLIIHLALLTGLQFQKNRQINVSPYTIEQWENNLEITQGVFSTQEDFYKQAKELLEEENRQCWGSYRYLQNQIKKSEEEQLNEETL